MDFLFKGVDSVYDIIVSNIVDPHHARRAILVVEKSDMNFCIYPCPVALINPMECMVCLNFVRIGVVLLEDTNPKNINLILNNYANRENQPAVANYLKTNSSCYFDHIKFNAMTTKSLNGFPGKIMCLSCLNAEAACNDWKIKLTTPILFAQHYKTLTKDLRLKIKTHDRLTPELFDNNRECVCGSCFRFLYWESSCKQLCCPGCGVWVCATCWRRSYKERDDHEDVCHMSNRRKNLEAILPPKFENTIPSIDFSSYCPIDIFTGKSVI